MSHIFNRTRHNYINSEKKGANLVVVLVVVVPSIDDLYSDLRGTILPLLGTT